MKIFCSGIGGIGLSAYVSLQAAAGHTVMGSDRTGSIVTDDVAQQGVEVCLEQAAENITDDLDLFVYSEAIPIDHPERVRAQELSIRSIPYFQALGELLAGNQLIAVCGTHGKSSTTAMITRMLLEAGRDPSVAVGTRLRELNGRNWRRGSENLWVVEACEYRRSFLHLHPTIIVLTSADPDHLDYFGSADNYRQAYCDFLAQLTDDGCVITHAEDADCQAVVQHASVPIIDADTLPLPTVGVPGMHMRQNGQLVLTVAEKLGIDRAHAITALEGYQGSWRRFELKGYYNDVPVIDDYGHHPKEVEVTIAAMREQYSDKRIVCVYQPHMHHRTMALYDNFLACFQGVDLLVIPNIYNARSDVETGEINVDTLVDDIARVSNTAVINGYSLEETEKKLRTQWLQAGDALLIMGAGDVTDVATALVKD